jgi:hypothetical protein
MERDKRIELSPPPWQGGVLPLYESRLRSNDAPTQNIYSMALTEGQERAGNANPERKTAENSDRRERDRPSRKKPAKRLIDFHDARCLHDRRFLLAFGKPLSTFAVNIDAGELFAVVVVHGYLPVAMFTPSILIEPAGTLLFCPGFSLRFLHDEMALDACDYGKFDLAAQVARRGLTVLIFRKCE